jgi:hypothetical protein
MTTVFVLYHVHELDDGHEDVKLIGIFTTSANAAAAFRARPDPAGFSG